LTPHYSATDITTTVVSKHTVIPEIRGSTDAADSISDFWLFSVSSMANSTDTERGNFTPHLPSIAKYLHKEITAANA